jgi:cellulose synthase/poly-beta-1,6-N-acetylglucosamine synthase-like glycosyltransferase
MAACLDGLFPFWALLTLSLAGTYVFVIAQYIRGWKRLRPWEIPPAFQPKTFVSVIIPARNEAENILPCLHSLSSQTYPAHLFEVIVVDDHSTDGTLALAQNFAQNVPNLKCVSLPDSKVSGKKSAIAYGIGLAQGELIATTDADCILPPGWLMLLASFYENKQPRFIAAPVNFHQEKNLFERFQSLDFLGMMCVTGAGIQLGWMHMCNGANLAYPKEVFLEVNGYENVDRLASGDDMFLMQKIARRYPGRVGFLKNKRATVLTKAMPDWPSFLSQRIRWASKSTSYSEWRVTMILALVFFFCLFTMASLALVPCWGWKAAWLFALLFSIKSMADFVFLRKMARYFDRPDLMKSYFHSQILHIIYIVAVGILSNITKKYQWKGRRVS